jgi:hypothetical protein
MIYKCYWNNSPVWLITLPCPKKMQEWTTCFRAWAIFKFYIHLPNLCLQYRSPSPTLLIICDFPFLSVSPDRCIQFVSNNFIFNILDAFYSFLHGMTKEWWTFVKQWNTNTPLLCSQEHRCCGWSSTAVFQIKWNIFDMEVCFTLLINNKPPCRSSCNTVCMSDLASFLAQFTKP